MKTDKELWLPIKGLEGFYEVSNQGRIRTVARFYINESTGYSKTIYGRIIETCINNKRSGYVYATFKVLDNSLTKSVHRIVAESFILNPNNFEEVNHKNFDKTDNSVENLEWVTSDENKKHFLKNGLRVYARPRAKMIMAFKDTGEFVGLFRSVREAGRHLNVFGQNISAIAKGKCKKVKGYVFRYPTEEESKTIKPTDVELPDMFKPKLTLEQVKEVRTREKMGKEYAKEFGVCVATISRLQNLPADKLGII